MTIRCPLETFISVGWLMANVISVHLLECMCDALVWCGCLYLCVFWGLLYLHSTRCTTHTPELCQLSSSGRRHIPFEVCVFSFFCAAYALFFPKPIKTITWCLLSESSMVVTLPLLYRPWKTHTHIKFFEKLANNTILMIIWLTILFEKYVT